MGVDTISKSELHQKVQKELDDLQPYMQSHQGFIRLVSIENWNVLIRLEGACDTCPLSFYTITFGLEKKLRASISPLIRVITDD